MLNAIRQKPTSKWYSRPTWCHWVWLIHNFRGLPCFPLRWKLFIYLCSNFNQVSKKPPSHWERQVCNPSPLTGVSTSTFHSNGTEYSSGWIGCYPVSKAYQEEKKKNQRTGYWEGPLRAVSLGVSNFRIGVTSFPTYFRHY